jgi:hypothetical protein
VEHSEGKDGESAVAIPRSLCGSPRPYRLKTTPFWSRWQALSCVLFINACIIQSAALALMHQSITGQIQPDAANQPYYPT